MLSVPMSKPAGYFVGRFFPVGPNAENFVVGNVVWHATKGFFFETLKFSDYVRGSFRISDAETALPLEGQFDHNFSHGAGLLSVLELYHNDYAGLTRLNPDEIN